MKIPPGKDAISDGMKNKESGSLQKKAELVKQYTLSLE